MNIICTLSQINELFSYLMKLENAGLGISQLQISFDFECLADKITFISPEGTIMAKQESIDFNQLREFIETGHPISLSLIPTVSKKAKQKKSQKVQRKANKQNDTTIWQNRPTLKQNKPEHKPDTKVKDPKIDSAPQQIGNHTFQI